MRDTVYFTLPTVGFIIVLNGISNGEGRILSRKPVGFIIVLNGISNFSASDKSRAIVGFIIVLNGISNCVGL